MAKFGWCLDGFCDDCRKEFSTGNNNISCDCKCHVIESKKKKSPKKDTKDE